jgi:hypothetical protein
MPVIPALRRQKQDQEFKARCTERFCLKIPRAVVKHWPSMKKALYSVLSSTKILVYSIYEI